MRFVIILEIIMSPVWSLFLNKYIFVYLKTRLNWSANLYRIKTSSCQFPEVNIGDTFVISPSRELKYHYVSRN